LMNDLYGINLTGRHFEAGAVGLSPALGLPHDGLIC